MVSEWIECTLGDIIELKRGYDPPKKQRADGSIPIISSSGVSDYHAESKVKAPGVVTGRYGTIGEVFYSEEDFWSLNTTLYVKDFKGNSPKFIYYFLKTIPYHLYSDKAAVPGVNRNHLYLAPVKVPSNNIEQGKIAEILGALDDKIQLNRQTNQTLESMAQALFKSWFVDFDPVIDNALAAGNAIPEPLQARAEQRKALQCSSDTLDGQAVPQLPEAIRQLFPKSFVLDAEMGWIPEGWEACLLNKYISILNGFAFKSKDYKESGTFVLRTKNFNNLVVDRLADDVFLPEAFLSSHEKYLCQPFDYHLVMVGASVGSRGLIFPHQLPALRNQNMWCFRTNNSSIVTQPFVKYLLDHTVVGSRGLASGSAREFFRKGDFGDQKICIGSVEVQQKFHDLCYPYLQQQGILKGQNDKLSNLRDTLLPKLISGELRIPGAAQDAQELEATTA